MLAAKSIMFSDSTDLAANTKQVCFAVTVIKDDP